jgi:hypothetical protein
MPTHHEDALRAATDAILESEEPRRLVVAGPGAGKTYLFRESLHRLTGEREQRLVLTFINNLKNDLERDLGTLAQVFTFHGFCRSLLHRSAPIRGALTEHFHYFPQLPSLIKSDWELTHDEAAPHFVGMMRTLSITEAFDFYLQRANYYDAVSFDYSVFRTYDALKQHLVRSSRLSRVGRRIPGLQQTRSGVHRVIV